MPDARPRRHGCRSTALGLAFMAVLQLAPAQEPSSSAEEPDWSRSGGSQDVITLEDDLAGSQPSVQPPPAAPQPSAVSSPSLQATAAVIEAQKTAEETLASTETTGGEGTPATDNWNLPDFGNSLDPFFQMEGLKIRLGELQLRFALNASFRYNDNIFADHTPRIGDYITTITPTFIAAVGDFRKKQENYFSLSYAPQPELFAIHRSQDTINQFLTMSGQYAFPRLTTSAGFRYSKDSNPTDDEVGRRENIIYDFNLDNSYALGAKTFFELGLNANYSDRENSVDYTTLSTNVALAYQYSPKTRISFGPVAGITFVDGGGEQPFQGANLSVNYSTLRKLSFNAMIGVQARQFRGSNPSGQSDFITPVFGLGAVYTPTKTTSFDLDLVRSVQNSGLVRGQSVITNKISLSWKQKLLTKFVFSLGLGYSALQYQGTGTNDRTDSIVNVSPSLGYEFWDENCVLSIFYSRHQRISELEYRDYYSNSFGTRIECKF